MLSEEKIREIARKHFPTSTQPWRDGSSTPEGPDGVTIWERDQAEKAIREALEENAKTMYSGKPEAKLCPLGDF